MIFFDKKCNIYSVTQVKENNREIDKETLLYGDVECCFYVQNNRRQGLVIGEVAKEEIKADYSLILPWWDRLWMKLWDRVELINPKIWSFWMYKIIDNPQVYELPNGVIDSVSLQLKKSTDELQWWD